MTTIPCPLCGSDGPHQKVEDTEPPYQVLVCQACDYGFVYPLPSIERLSEAYGEAYYEPWRVDDVAARERMWQGRINRVLKKVRSGKLLEVGAGDGDFLKEAVAAGFDVSATEFSETAGKNIKNKIPQASVYVGEVESLDISLEAFDVVAAWHSLEHMRYPFRALDSMYQALKPGGWLFVAVPNRNNFLMRFFYRLVRRRAYPLFSLHTKEIHLSHFTPKSLCMAVEGSGFEVSSTDWDKAMVEPTKRIIDWMAVIPSFFGSGLGTEAMLLIARKPQHVDVTDDGSND